MRRTCRDDAYQFVPFRSIPAIHLTADCTPAQPGHSGFTDIQDTSARVSFGSENPVGKSPKGETMPGPWAVWQASWDCHTQQMLERCHKALQGADVSETGHGPSTQAQDGPFRRAQDRAGRCNGHAGSGIRGHGVLSCRRSSCSASSGVRKSPKSAISYSGRISTSLGPGIGLGHRFTHSTASSMS